MSYKTLLCFGAGILTVVIISSLKPANGVLLIDSSDPEKDIYRCVVNDDLEKLRTKRKVIFKVNNHADLSQN